MHNIDSSVLLFYSDSKKHNITSEAVWLISDMCNHMLTRQKPGHESITSMGDQVGISLSCTH